MLECKRLDLAFLFEHLPSYQPLILAYALPPLDQTLTKDWIAIEARLNQQLVGLALGKFFSHNQTVQLYSLVVAEAHRRQGIGLTLFQSFQKEAIEQIGCRAIGFEYDGNSPFAPAVEKILSHLQWSSPKFYLVRCHFRVHQFNPPWYQRHLQQRLFPEMQIFSWKDLTSQERGFIKIGSSQGRFMPYLSPLRDEAIIEFLNSVGLRYKDALIGWCITHRLNEETIRYSALYIENEFLLSGYAIRLLAHSIYLQKSSPIPLALFEINLDEIDRSWWSFVKKRLIPYADRVEWKKWAIRFFAPF